MGRSRWQFALILAGVVGSLAFLGAMLTGRALLWGRLSLLAEQTGRWIQRYEATDIAVEALPPIVDGDVLGLPLTAYAWTPPAPPPGLPVERVTWTVYNASNTWLAQIPHEVDLNMPFRGGNLYLRVSLRETFATFHANMEILMGVYFGGIGLAAFGVGFLFFRQRFLRPIEKLIADASDPQSITKAADRLPTSPLEITRLARVVQNTSRQLQANANDLQNALTELKTAQDELLRSETLASLGEFAGSIVHEIGNPLTVAIGYSQILARPGTSAEQMATLQPKIVEQLARIRGIVEGLVALQHNAVRNQEVVRLPDLVRSAARRLAESNFVAADQVVFDAMNDDVRAVGDPFLIEQVFWNAIKNAAESVPPDRVPSIRVSIAMDDATAEVIVTDNGSGFAGDPSAYAQPLISTKGQHGMGMGLALSLRIVEIVGGKLTIRSTEKGSELRFAFPRHKSIL